ncbi:hypothetical protein FWF74_02665 [Candidatus Saccharibacteria bacterium]|nr:hypothetical protein [Candidatus Saccharibacteria bacterium]MCL1962729.1 hypothetical protein [Candidatus Saccharibacteria bacterium]
MKKMSKGKKILMISCIVLLLLVVIIVAVKIMDYNNNHSNTGSCDNGKALCLTFYEEGGGCGVDGRNCAEIDEVRKVGVDVGDKIDYNSGGNGGNLSAIKVNEITDFGVNVTLYRRILDVKKRDKGCAKSVTCSNNDYMVTAHENIHIHFGQKTQVNDNVVYDAPSSNTSITITKMSH